MRPPLLLLTFAALAAEAAPKLDFNRDIRPILSDNCFACHGFDAKKRKADLRLDTPEGATAINDGVQAIKPGDPEGSELIKRLLTKDPEEVMPPPESHKKLTQAQIDTLRRWIAEGAPYRWQPFTQDEAAVLHEKYADDLFWLAAGAEGLAQLTGNWQAKDGANPQPAQTKRGSNHDQRKGCVA